MATLQKISQLMNLLRQARNGCSTYCLTYSSRVEASIHELEASVQELEAKKKELEALTVSHSKLQRALERLHDDPGNDGVVFTFATEGDESVQTTVTCSRQAMRHWSPPFDALIRHGNSMAGDFPSQVQVEDVKPIVFKQALHFQCSGCFQSEWIAGAEQHGHALLQFADRYDLQDLKDQYIANAWEKVPLCLQAVSWHLNLAFAANHIAHKERCVLMLAKAMDTPSGKDQFVKLGVEAAAAVLSHDQLMLAGGREKEVMASCRLWAFHHEDRLSQGKRLLDSVRFCLFGAQELLDLQEEVETSDSWNTLRPALTAAIRLGLSEKLRSDSPARARKRSSTVLPNEGPLLKALRKTVSIFQMDTQGGSAASA
eukprot:CAMPEP_0172810498 /NCGR_PEP_ID=MMETSP1075-20121228/8839_1 /TAXON_ID=2916 /ORGANISM="Ceratium fusus, Strain PA161109" /LENGTH=370 /DNA_ID=CAMNT_0013649817 /DNA_START=41 /DNA_END=1153 /DNA_ORIENTATION=+